MTTRGFVAGCLAALLAAPLVPLAGAPASGVATRVASSTTSIALSSTRSAYGQTVTATAAVATSSGLAEGDVYFTVDKVSTKVNLSATGTATLVLRDGEVGQHDVVATFVPQFPDQQQGSSSSTQSWEVEPVRTRLFVKAIGRGLRIPTSVRVEAGGEYGTAPTGPVTLTLTRAGSRRTIAKARTLPPSGVVMARYGTLRKGTYRIAVAYAGDGRHQSARRVQWFRVRQL